MPVKFYSDEALTQELARSVGKLDGDGTTTTFSVEEEPDAVRIYSEDKVNGELVEGWTYDSENKTVTLPSAPAEGETAVAIKNDLNRLFEGQDVASNSSDETVRTFEQRIFYKVEGCDAKGLTISVADWVSGAGINPSQEYYLSEDNNGSPAGYGNAGEALNLGDNPDGTTGSLWVKCVVEQNKEEGFYRDPQLQAGYRELPVE